LASL
jgi:hypothetical protein